MSGAQASPSPFSRQRAQGVRRVASYGIVSPAAARAVGAGGDSSMSDDKNTVKSVVKAFAVLQAFRPDASEMVLADVARAASLDNGTAFRLLNTLVSLGYVEKVPGTRRFRLTFKCLDLGFNAIARSDLRSLARPLLRAMVGDRIEAASVGVLDGHEVVYVERIQAGLTRLAVDVRVGYRVPAYSSALGRAIMSRMPVEMQRALLEAAPPRQLTAHTVTEIDRLLAQIAQAKADGFAISDQETVTGLRVIAAPITDIDGVPIAALSAVAPSFGHTLEEFIADTRDVTCDAARRLSLALRASGGTAAQTIAS
jgi:IclR family transcriptional regulator, pca regulon regulatory protein